MNEPEGVGRPVATKAPTYRVPNGANMSIGDRATVLALDALGRSKTEIADEVGISRNTVAGILKHGDHTDPRIVERVKREMEGRFWVTAARMNDAITDEKLEKATALQLITGQAIATDKALLLAGKPTVRIEHTTVEDQEAAQQIEALQAQLDGWKDGSTVNVDVVGGDVGGTTDDAPTV